MTSMTHVPDARLVVTGHDADTRGVIASDARIGPTPGLAADGWETYSLWAAQSLPTLPDDGRPDVDPNTARSAGVRFVQCVVHPDGSPAPVGDPEVLSAVRRSPGDTSAMHFTSSVDLVVVIDGEVEVRLDNTRTVLRQGDFLVQNGTRHEWHNHGDRPARLGVVVLKTEHRGF